MTTKIEAVKSVFAQSAQAQAEIKTQAESAMLQALETDNNAEALSFKAQMQRAATHEKFDTQLSSMSDKAVSAMNKYKLSAEELSKQSREAKKRTIALLEAIATNSFAKDKAFDAIMNVIAEKNPEKMTISKIQHEMQHETDTQATYFKRFALFCKFAQYSASTKEVVFNYDSQIMKDLMSIYRTTASAE